MKKLKSIVLFFIIFAICFSFVGCWNYKDVELQFVVMGMAIDIDPATGEYLIHAEISKAKGGTEAELITRLETARGITLYDATRNIIAKIGAKVYWGHTMVYVLSERLAKQGIADAIGVLSRQTQVRSDIFILVCESESIEKIFEFEDPIHEDISQHLHDLEEDYEASTKYRRAPLFIVLQELASNEISLTLPYIKMVKIESEESKGGEGKTKSSGGEETKSASEEKVEEIIVADGSTVFKGDIMVGRIDGLDTQSVLILKEEAKENYILTIKESEELPSCTIEVINSDLNIDPVLDKEENLGFNIELKLEGDLVELHTERDLVSEEEKGDLEDAFEAMLENQIRKTIEKTQKDYQADIFGFASVTHRKQGEYWSALPMRWEDIYEKAEIDVSVDIEIESSSLSMGSIRIGR